MIDRLTWVRLTVAAAVSCAAHAVFIAFGRIDIPQAPSALPPLAARIESPPPSVKPPAEIKPARRTREPAQARAVSVVSAPSAVSANNEAEPADIAAHDEPRAEEAPSAPLTPTEPTVLATAPPSSETLEPSPARSLPRKGRITYNLVYGRDRFPVGRTIQTWEVNGERYILASRSETTGIVDLVRSQHRTFLSRGSVTRNGLRPDLFVMSRNRGRGTEEAKATFDWSEESVTLGAAGERQVSLPARTQDLLSFMYQLSVDPPPHGRFRQPLTNGSRLETHEVEVLAEETIETPLGALRALPVRQVRKPGSESLDLWLATEYRYLPVRIRFFNREGEPQGEQIVTEIRVSDE